MWVTVTPGGSSYTPKRVVSDCQDLAESEFVEVHAKALNNRGNARQNRSDLDEAIADWQRFVNLAPNHRVAPAICRQVELLRRGH